MKRRNRLIIYTAIDALLITALSIALYPTEYWVWGVIFSLIGCVWLGAFFAINSQVIIDWFLKCERPTTEADDLSTGQEVVLPRLNSNRRAA